MSEVESVTRFQVGIHCTACEWSMPLDELRAKGGKIVRNLKEPGVTHMVIETPEPACPRCGGRVFRLRFAI